MSVLASDFQIVNGIFVAIAYGVDLSLHKLVYDSDRKVVITTIGPFVKSIRESKVEDIEILNRFGDNVVSALLEHAKEK